MSLSHEVTLIQKNGDAIILSINGMCLMTIYLAFKKFRKVTCDFSHTAVTKLKLI
jgi:hypothetical protein